MLEEARTHHDIVVNEYVLLESQHNPHNNQVFRYLGGEQFQQIVNPALKWPLEARNPQQLMALDLLLDTPKNEQIPRN